MLPRVRIVVLVVSGITGADPDPPTAQKDLGILTHCRFACPGITKPKGDFILESLGIPDLRTERAE